MSLSQLIEIVKTEDTAEYLGIIKHINSAKLDTRSIKRYLNSLGADKLGRLTTTQVQLLWHMPYKNGDTLWYGDDPLLRRIMSGLPSIAYSKRLAGLETVPKEDTIYLSAYCYTKWLKANPSRTNAKGTTFTFSMDMFSLAIFKSVIPANVLRTEAKNLIIAINRAFSASSKGLAEIKVRNKFYAVVLANTSVLTKATLNAIMETRLVLEKGYYEPDADEVIGVSLYEVRSLSSITTGNVIDTYSTDTAIISHNLGYETKRDADRVVSTASAFSALAIKTSNPNYAALASRTVAYLDNSYKVDALEATSSIIELRKILLETQKEPHE